MVHEPDFVDAHVHFWDHSVPGLTWAFLQPAFAHPTLGDLRQLDAPKYTAAEFRAEAAAFGVTKVIHIQAADAADPAIETAWLQQMGDQDGWPNAIIGHCDLTGDDVAGVLARHSQFSRFRGVRDLGASRRLSDPAFARGLAVVARTGATVEVATSVEHVDDLLALIRGHPDLLVVVGHAGSPERRDDDYHRVWIAGMRRLGREPNTVCKISALLSADRSLSVERIRPWVLGCLEAFGARRCMFASDWPVDRLFTGYGELLGAYRAITAQLSPSEQHAVFAGTAESVYGV